MLVQLYKKLLDYTNITYLISTIKKHGFKEVDFIVSSPLTAFLIIKTIIFIHNIDIIGDLELYLQSRLFSKLQKKAIILIQIFLANLKVDIRL